MADNNDNASVSSGSSDAYVPLNPADTARTQRQQNPGFHAPTLAGDIAPEDRTFLADVGGWTQTPVGINNDPTHASNIQYNPNDYTWALDSYVPYWTKPGFDLRRQQDFAGSFGPVHRYHDDGSFFSSSRPAILPVDRAKIPTEYALRFGIDPRAPKSSTGQARSRFTPTDEHQQFTWQTPEEQEADEGLQKLWQGGYPSSELREIGAYDPLKEVTPADLDGPVHSLFQRSRWTQRPWPLAKCGFWGGTWNIRYNIGNDLARYDVKANPRVWEAIKPSLLLASNLLASEHPIFDILGSFYHLRRVEPWRDRQDAAGLRRYGHHKSLHYEIDESSEYPTAQFLRKNTNFDPKKAADAILEYYLTLSLVNHGSDGFTQCGDKDGYCEVRLCVNARWIWPLLEPRYSDADKASSRYQIATTLLHELAHAYCYAVDLMLTSPSFLQQTPYGQTLSTDVIASLRQLGNEMLPPYQPNVYNLLGYSWAGFLRGKGVLQEERFFEDEVQGEAGFSTEKQIWGGRISYLPSDRYNRKGLAFHHTPAVISWSYPSAHPQPHFTRALETDNPYTRFLASPAGDVWSTGVAIPTETYAAYFRQPWWQCDYQKFGPLSLRLKPFDAQNRLLRATLSAQDGEAVTTEITRASLASGSGHTARWMLDTAYENLVDAGCVVLAEYLRAMTLEVASAKTFRRRLYYERRTWDAKFRMARRSVAGALASLQTWENALAQIVILPPPGRTGPATAPATAPASSFLFTEANVEGLLGQLIQFVFDVAHSLGHIRQFLAQDIMYSQALVEMYLQQSATDRPKIYRRYMRDLLLRLREISTHATTLSDRLTTALVVGSGAGNSNQADSPNCEFVLRRKILTDLGDQGTETWDALWRQLAGDVDRLRLARQTVGALRAAADDVISQLVLDGGNNGLSSSAALPEDPPHIARARARHPARSLRAAAMRQFRELDSRHRRRRRRPRRRNLNPRASSARAGSSSSSSSSRNSRNLYGGALPPVPGDELASRLDRIALTVAKRWIRLLNNNNNTMHAALDPTSWVGVSAMARRLDMNQTETRAALMTEARSLVENERRGREARRRNQLPSLDDLSLGQEMPPGAGPGGGGGGSVLGDPTLAEVREAIKRLAGTNVRDAQFLAQQWTEEAIQALLDGQGDGDGDGDDGELDDAMDGLGI